MNRIVVPALIAKSQDELNERLNRVKRHATLFQLDVMDGKFVPNQSLDFDFTVPKDLAFEAHLMIHDPGEWIEKHGEKVQTILPHIESCEDPEGIIRQWRGKKKVGFVLNPETPLKAVENFLDDIDQVLVMTVNPGFYGSPFLPETLDKVRELRALRPDLSIEVDGGITPDTIRAAHEAGANIFVSGSYIVKAEDVKRAVSTLERLIRQEK